MTWETIIGLETHVELATRTKIFCSCTTEFGGAPNTHCCPVCTGMPGTLPVLNQQVVELAVKAGLALNCEITRSSRFDRKNYFYPDLPKAYQISQLYAPIARDGAVDIGEGKTIRIHEMHMEEDAGKLVHDPWLDQTKADYNRCGVPLIEIVTEPDFRSADEVIAYLEKLKEILQYLGVSDCKMQEGSLRCDVNLSVRPMGSQELGTRTEMKNLNSFKAIGGTRTRTPPTQCAPRRTPRTTATSPSRIFRLWSYPRSTWSACGPSSPSWPRPSGPATRRTGICLFTTRR